MFWVTNTCKTNTDVVQEIKKKCLSAYVTLEESFLRGSGTKAPDILDKKKPNNEKYKLMFLCYIYTFFVYYNMNQDY